MNALQPPQGKPALRDACARPGAKRVAIYTRQSVDRTSDSDFGSLEAQREAIEAYVKSQRHEGWVALPEIYADGGFSGASTDRPAFRRLMEDVEAGRVDVVAVYKIDRLSRSLMDFAGIMRTFEEHGVDFASITQQFSTGSSMGKLTLNILMSFAEFEREVISERTRDKIAASRRKGLWVGGHVPLGFQSRGGKLEIVPEEAERVREIFGLYLKLGTLAEVCRELNRRGWTTKKGAMWRKSTLSNHLKQKLYIGMVPYKEELHQGQHEAIVDSELFDAVQRQLKCHRQRGGARAKNKWAMLLKGLLVCGRCGARMMHTYSKKGERLYHYYLCPTHHTPGSARCEGYRVAARKIEAFVVARIREIGTHPGLVTATLEAAQTEAERAKPGLLAEHRKLQAEHRRIVTEREALLDALPNAGKAASTITHRIAETDERIRCVNARLVEVRGELAAMEAAQVEEEDVARAMTEFEGIWGELLPRERQRLLALVVEEIRYDADEGEVEIRYRPGGLRTLAQRRGA